MYSIEDERSDQVLIPTLDTFYQEYQTRMNIDSEKYRKSGFSANTMFDSRDNITDSTEIRFMVIPQKLINMGLDYGWSAAGASGLFISINEFF